MTDRELLEAAAKAAGWKGWRSKHGYWIATDPEGKAYTCCKDWASYSSSTGEKYPEPEFGDAMLEVGWNPLTDDGDALRLAVKLGFINPGQWPNPSLVAAEEWAETGSIDWYAATRRAIVRAAAAIGGAK